MTDMTELLTIIGSDMWLYVCYVHEDNFNRLKFEFSANLRFFRKTFEEMTLFLIKIKRCTAGHTLNKNIIK